MNITNNDNVTNEEVRNKIQDAIDKHDDLLFVVKTHKLRWYGHFSRAFGMAKTISARDEAVLTCTHNQCFEQK